MSETKTFIDIDICKSILHEYLKTSKTNKVTLFAINTIYQRYVNATHNSTLPYLPLQVEHISSALLKNGLIDIKTKTFILNDNNYEEKNTNHMNDSDMSIVAAVEADNNGSTESNEASGNNESHEYFNDNIVSKK
jgi:hypothetical protein